MTERELLRAVAEAAFGLRESSGMTSMELERTLDALSAYRAPPQEAEREMVEVRAHVRLAPGCSAYIVSGMGDLNGAWTDPMPGTAFAILTARVPLPAIPTIPAKVVT